MKESKEQEHDKKIAQKEKKDFRKQENQEMLFRILSTDIPGNKNVYTGLTRIKGISWAFSNALCNVLKINKNKKISELTEKEIEAITDFIKNPKVPEFLYNRRKDFDTGKDEHLIGTDLDLRKEFDIKRLKKIRSYKGVRHATGQPVRGQRTKSHFRKNKAIGVQKKSKPGK